MLSPTISNTHAIAMLNFRQLSLKLLIGCLVLVLTSSVTLANGKERPNNRADKATTDSTEKRDAVTSSDRPGKPDEHNSNGDDVPVRPPRRAKS